jgi:hypothetical protein
VRSVEVSSTPNYRLDGLQDDSQVVAVVVVVVVVVVVFVVVVVVVVDAVWMHVTTSI